MARKKKEQERVKTFSEMEAERRNRESGREAGGSRPASMSFSEMEQSRRNQNDKAIVSYIKNRYPDTVDSAAARQAIRTRAARNEAESMLNRYAQGLSGFQSRLQSLNRTGRNEEDAAAAKSTARRAFQDAGEIRSYLRNNRGDLGEDAAEKYDALLDQYVKGYGTGARMAQNTAKKYRNTEESRKEAIRQDKAADLYLTAAAEDAAIAETRQRAWYDTNELENRKAAEMADYMAAVRRGDVKYDEATADGIRKKYDDQIEAMRQDTAEKYGTKGNLNEQLSELEARNLETRKKGEAIYGDEIRQLQDELYNTRDPEKRRQIEERLAQIEYFDTRERNGLEIAAQTALAGGASWLSSIGGTPYRIMESLFPGFAEGQNHNYEADTVWEYLNDGKGKKTIGGVLQFLYDQTKTQAEAEERRRQEMVRNKSEIVQFISNATTSVVPMVADMILASATGGLGVIPETEQLIGSSTTGYRMLKNLVNSPYFYSTMVQEFAGTWDEEVAKGVDPTTAGLEATLVGVLNAGIELGFGVEGMAGVQELPGDIAERLANAGTEGAKVNVLKEWLKDAINEGNEELMQKFVGDVVSQITADPKGLLSMYSEKDAVEFAEAWGGGALVGGLMGAANGVQNRIAEGSREQYTAEDERITRYLEEIAREKGDTSSASLRSAPSPQGEGAGTSPREEEEVRAPQTAQETAETQRTVPEGMTEEEAERAAMTPEEREVADREAREAERDLRELVEESEASAKDRSEEREAADGPFGVSGTGRIETGKDATIAGVERVQNGEMIYRLSDGSTINAEDVKYANLGEATVAEAVATLGVDRQGAEILLREWAPDRTRVSGEIYAAGVALAYNYGLQGYRVEEVAANRNLRSMTENQIRAAYELGRIERDERARRSDERLRQIAPTEARESRGGVRIEAGAVIRGETQEAQVKALDAIGRAVGVRIVVYDGGTGEAGQPGVNGFYDARDRSIHINLRAGASGDGIMLNTAAHELTHYIHDTARTEYNKLADFLFGQYGKAGVTLSAMIAEEKQAALDAGRQISDEEAMMEVVADSMETMLSDGVVIETLTRENRTLAQKIAGKIGDLVRKIRSIGRAAGAETIEGRIVQDAVREGEKLREMWTQALRKAAEVGTTSEAESDQKYVSYSVRRARAADRVTLLSEASIEDATDQETIEAISQFQIREAELQAAEGEMRATEHEIAALEAAGKDQNSDRIAELNEKLYLQSRAVEEGRHNLRKKANSKEMRAIAEKVLQRRIAETEALEEAVPKEENRTRTLSAIEEKAKEIAALRKSNELLKKKLEAAKEELTVRDSRSFRRDDLDKLARSLLRKYQNSTMDPNEVREELRKIGQMLIDGDTVEIKAHLSDAIRPLAEAIIGDARESIDVNKDTREKLAEWMRAGIRIPKNNVNDLDPAFRRRNAWWIRVNNGESVDVVYEELATQFGEGLFPPDVINPADMAERIAEIYDAMKPIEQNPHAGIENAMIESVIQDVVDGMISESMRLQPLTARERYEAKIEETERALSETKKQLREERNARRKEQRRTAEELLRDKGEKILARMEQSAWMTDMVDRIQKRNDRITTMRRIISTAKTLERDLTGQTKNRVVEKFRKPVAELVAALDINMPAYDAAVRRVNNLEKRIAAAGENAGYRARLEQDLAEAKKKRDFLERKHAAVYEILKRELGTGDVKEELRKYAERGIQGPLEAFLSAYWDTRNDQSMEGAYDDTVYHAAKEAIRAIGKGRKLTDLDMQQLKALEDAITMIRHKVRHGEQLFQTLRDTDLKTMASKTMNEIGQVESKKKKAYSYQAKTNKVRDWAEENILWGNLKPETAMERIGSRELLKLYEAVRQGELDAAVGGEQAKTFMAAMREKYNAKKWDVKSAREFQAKHGKTVSLTLPQMMALYAYSKRGDAAAVHLSQGGFILQDAIRTVTEPDEKGKNKKTYQVRDGAAYAMGTDEIAKVVGELTKEQTDYVDAMQKYLSEVMGAKGNAVSLQLYGVRQFQEKNYFPLMVSQAFIDSRLEKTVGESQIKNMGFTKALIPNANSAVVLEGFDDVWARHVSEMEMYCAFTLPLENITKVYNYKIYASEGDEGDSVKAQLGRVWGKNATGYIEQLLKDINGQPAQREIAGADKLLRIFKVAKTAGSLSTIAQQPTSVWRAMAYIDQKYFLPQRISLRSANRLYNEMKEYAPVAILKDMGRFDTGTGRTLREYIQDNQKWTEKMQEAAGKGAELADQYTWVQIWEAAKRQAAAERKKPVRGFSADKIIRYTGDITEVQAAKEELLKRAGQIADEAIVKTQVYDSVFTRSQNMRRQGIFSKMATAFMAEPTTTMNQFISGIWDLGSGQKERGARKMATAFVSAIAAAVASSFVYAMRDKDDDKTYAEKLIKHGVGEILDEINPLTYFPYIRDINSLLQGYSVERSDMTQISDLISAVNKLFKGGENAGHKIGVVCGEIANFSGIPLKNLQRDFYGIYRTAQQTVNQITGGESILPFEDFGRMAEMGFREALPAVVRNQIPEMSKKDKLLYNAWQSGNESAKRKWTRQYKDEETAEKAVIKLLAAEDERIGEAAQARLSGDATRYGEIIQKIAAEGKFTEAMIAEAERSYERKISSAASDAKKAYLDEDFGALAVARDELYALAGEKLAEEKLEEVIEKANEEEDKESIVPRESIYTASDVAGALDNSGAEAAAEILADLIEAAGGEEAAANVRRNAKSAITSRMKPKFVAAAESGNRELMEEIIKKLTSSGLYGARSEVEKTVEKWIG